MSTTKQKKVARAIVENLNIDRPLNGGEIVENSGYGKSMRLYPGRILESEGVIEELKELGFSVEAADQVVWELLHKGRKEETKLKAADTIYKRLGAYEDTKQGSRTLILMVSGESASRYGVHPNTKSENNSQGQTQIPGVEMWPKMGEDDIGDRPNEGKGSNT